MTRPPAASAIQNPLLAAWTGAFELPPFAQIEPGHFRSAFDRALVAHRAEIDAIAADPTAPSFDNTVAALEKSGRELDRVADVFHVLAGADTSDEIEAIERDVSPLLARHNNALYLNRALFGRIADLYKQRETTGSQRRAGPCSGALSYPFRARRCRAGKTRAGASRGY